MPVLVFRVRPLEMVQVPTMKIPLSWASSYFKRLKNVLNIRLILIGNGILSVDMPKAWFIGQALMGVRFSRILRGIMGRIFCIFQKILRRK
jgi:hypothetical protein